MNVLLLTIAAKKDQKMIRDMIQEFAAHGHTVFVACPADAENPPRKKFVLLGCARYLFIDCGSTIGKINLFKKVWNFLRTDPKYRRALRTALDGIDIQLVLYATPPITLANTIGWVKNQFGAQTYLMLKDIFPQNAVDMGMLKTTGPLGLVWRYFRRKEQKLYRNSDAIGCMSAANIGYVLQHNPEMDRRRVGLCVNAYAEEPLMQIDQRAVRDRYGIPQEKIVFLYGGNLGKPQGLSYFVEILRAEQSREDCFFLICGSGKAQDVILKYIQQESPPNVKYIPSIPPDDFDELTRACDVGLVFLDYRFTIPNFPSRMLSIMLNEKPILAATDRNTDVGAVIQDGQMGWWCESSDVSPFLRLVDEICSNPSAIQEKGRNARAYYQTHYTSEIAYRQIIDGLEQVDKRHE